MEHVVVPLVDDVGELRVRKRLDVRLDADIGEPLPDELTCRYRRVLLAAHEIAELQRLSPAGHLADPIAVGVLVTCFVQDRVGLIGIEVEQLILGWFVVIEGHCRRHDGGADRPVALQHPLNQRLAVDGHVDRPPHLTIFESGMPVRVWVLLIGSAIEADLLEAGNLRLVGADVLGPLERVVQVRPQGIGEVDLARFKSLDKRILVVKHSVNDLVDVGSAGPVVRIGLHAEELTLLPLHDVERPARYGIWVVLESLELLGIDVLEDVLREDVHVGSQQAGGGFLGRDLEGVVVHDLDVLDELEI